MKQSAGLLVSAGRYLLAFGLLVTHQQTVVELPLHLCLGSAPSVVTGLLELSAPPAAPGSPSQSARATPASWRGYCPLCTVGSHSPLGVSWSLVQLPGTAPGAGPPESIAAQPGSQLLLIFCCRLVGLLTFYPWGQDGKGIGFCGPNAWLHWQFSNRMGLRGVWVSLVPVPGRRGGFPGG